MEKIENIFDEFDFCALDFPEFKEDSVRESIIMPILKKLGYRDSGPYKLQRSKSLQHPYVWVGSQKKNITVIPDYTLYVKETPKAIIEAKGPGESVDQPSHIQQAYCYAMHPDILAQAFALCNGRHLVVYSVKSKVPVLKLETKDIGKHWNKVKEALHPEYLEDFNADTFVFDYWQDSIALKKFELNCNHLPFSSHSIRYDNAFIASLAGYLVKFNTYLLHPPFSNASSEIKRAILNFNAVAKDLIDNCGLSENPFNYCGNVCIYTYKPKAEHIPLPQRSEYIECKKAVIREIFYELIKASNHIIRIIQPHFENNLKMPKFICFCNYEPIIDEPMLDTSRIPEYEPDEVQNETPYKGLGAIKKDVNEFFSTNYDL